MGWKSPGGVKYRAAYAANNIDIILLCSLFNRTYETIRFLQYHLYWWEFTYICFFLFVNADAMDSCTYVCLFNIEIYLKGAMCCLPQEKEFAKWGRSRFEVSSTSILVIIIVIFMIAVIIVIIMIIIIIIIIDIVIMVMMLWGSARSGEELDNKGEILQQNTEPV